MNNSISQHDSLQDRSSSVLLEHRDGISWLRLNQPDRLNALSAVMVEGLISGLDDALANRSSLVVFSGEGRAFSAGFDLSGLDTQSDAELLCRFVRLEQLLQKIYQLPVTTLALVHGRAFGAAADIIATCRHRIASPDSSFRMPGLQFGVVLGTRRLGALIGDDAALDLLETSRVFSASEALDNGFLTNVKKQSDWPSLVLNLAQKSSNLNLEAKEALLFASRGDADVTSSMNADLVALVRSCTEPGLGDRIRNFVSSQVEK